MRAANAEVGDTLQDFVMVPWAAEESWSEESEAMMKVRSAAKRHCEACASPGLARLVPPAAPGL